MKWSAIERVCTQLIQFLIMLILARLLGPHSYGIIGMTTIVTAVSQILIDSGFSSALIRMKNIEHKHFDTTFVCNIVFSVFLYGIIYVTAPHIAFYFGQEELVSVLRVVSIIIIINSFSLIHKAKLTINLDFKRQSKITICSVSLSGLISISWAMISPSVWVLVCYMILNATISCSLYYLTSNWHPKIKFCKNAFFEMFSFGYKLVFASVLNAVYENIYSLIIARYYSVVDVGLFSQAKTLSLVPTNTYSSIIQRVTYRYFSEISDDKEKLKLEFLNIIKYSALIFFPCMMLLSSSSELVIGIVLGKEWLDASQILTYLSLCYMLYPLHALNLNILNVYGRSDLFLKLEIFKKILITIILFYTIEHGVIAISQGLFAYSIISTFINSIYTKRYINVSMQDQAKQVLPIYLISLISCHYPTLLFTSGISLPLNMLLSVFTIITAYSAFYRKEVLFFFKRDKRE